MFSQLYSNTSSVDCDEISVIEMKLKKLKSIRFMLKRNLYTCVCTNMESSYLYTEKYHFDSSL